MDAKSKANFINSVAAGAIISCSKCGESNRIDSKYCVSCGTELLVPHNNTESTPAFEQAKKPVVPVNSTRYVDPGAVFAQGLPEWSIEPPQVMVRRR